MTEINPLLTIGELLEMLESNDPDTNADALDVCKAIIAAARANGLTD